MASQDAAYRTRAADEVSNDFNRQRRELLDGQHLQFSASRQLRRRELDSFAANRDEAIKRHADNIRAIDARERTAAKELDKRHNSLAGRLSALIKNGRASQEQERQALAEKFENERFKKHRDLAALQERQAQNEQKARLRYGLELKAMRDGHIASRVEQRGWQTANRDRLTQDRLTAHQREATRGLQQDRQHEPLSRTFNR